MNVRREPIAVLRTVQTQMVHTCATAALAIVLAMMDSPAMVQHQHNTYEILIKLMCVYLYFDFKIPMSVKRTQMAVHIVVEIYQDRLDVGVIQAMS